MRNFILYVFLFLMTFSWSQTTLVINELEADSPSIDDKEFIELKSIANDMSEVPNFSTDGYILVFFNGSSSGGDASYFTIDLNGYSTDSNGLLVIGSLKVNPSPQVIIPDNIIQNGQDAVAIYQTSIDDFPDRTIATQANLVDALVYDTGEADDNNLLMLLGESTQYNDTGTDANPRSLQRQNDGTYISAIPSPRALNDGSGIIFNTVEISTTETQFNEGDSFTITFTSLENVPADIDFSISLNNGTFTSADFSGLTNLTIPSGQNITSTVITLLDDSDNEGDEELVIKINDLVEPIVAFNNLVTIRVVGNDFVAAEWGTPKDPTFDKVSSTQPTGYYNSLNGKSGLALRQAVQDIIADENTVRTHSYADVIDILKQADQNPKNNNQVWLVYTEGERSKLDFQTSSSGTGKWNREHTFPRSRGDFNDWDDFDDIATGINTFITTNADSTRHANSDAHALRVADASENSRRNNKHYSNNFSTASGIGEYNGPGNLNIDPLDAANNVGVSFRGDVARGVLYLDLRYNGLEIVNGFPTSSGSTFDGQLGDLSTLLQWHDDDIPDDYEMNRNNIVYQWQRNRNPLIDLPDLVDYIWGARVGEVYNLALSTNENQQDAFSFYPNPAKDRINFEGISKNTIIEVFSVDGRKIKDLKPNNSNAVELNLASGLYLLKFTEGTQLITKQLIIK